MTKSEMKMVENFKAESECETLVLALRNEVQEIYKIAKANVEWAMNQKGRAEEYYGAQCRLHDSFHTLAKLDEVVLAMAKEKEA